MRTCPKCQAEDDDITRCDEADSDCDHQEGKPIVYHCGECGHSWPVAVLCLPDGTKYEGRLQYGEDGKPIVDMATCGACGFSWNDAMITSVTPSPSARCPNEHNHDSDDE